MQKLLFRSAHVATSRDVTVADVLVQDGKIARIGASLPEEGARVINAEGKFLLPGGVDPHTHFDLDVGFTRASDNFYTGSIAAAFGGTTTVIDHMAFGPEGCLPSHQYHVYRDLARDAVVDYGLHGVIQHVNDEVLDELVTLRDEEGITSHKAYMTYDSRLDDKALLRLLEKANELGLVICAHCENDAIVNTLRQRFVDEGKTQPLYHPLSRPASAEAEAVFRFLMLARAAGEPKVYVVHLSSELGLRALRFVRSSGQKNVLAETCPQYLLLDDSLYNDPQEGLKAIMSPPLRKANDQAALWKALSKNILDTIGTDHCPFFFESQKQRGRDDFTQCPNGAAGVELRIPLLFSEGVMKGRITLPQLVRTCCTRPAQIFGLAPRKGDIVEGADADLVLLDPNVEWTVTKDGLHENVDYSLYEGMELVGKPVMTVLRGNVIVEGGQFMGEKGTGKYQKRTTG